MEMLEGSGCKKDKIGYVCILLNQDCLVNRLYVRVLVRFYLKKGVCGWESLEIIDLV